MEKGYLEEGYPVLERVQSESYTECEPSVHIRSASLGVDNDLRMLVCFGNLEFLVLFCFSCCNQPIQTCETVIMLY